MKRFLLAIVLFGVPAMVHGQAPRVRAAVPGYQRSLSMDSLASAFDIVASRGATFAAAAAVFDELKIPVDSRDSVGGVVGNTHLVAMHRFGGKQMSSMLSCGNGMTGPNADAWRIYITVMAMIEEKGEDKTILRVGFIAGAKDVDGASKDAVACGTLGTFESMFADRVKKRLLK
ncbi:MAG: hypothetical protein ABIT38_08445 [Gemmatimonadaceae bacterium]